MLAKLILFNFQKMKSPYPAFSKNFNHPLCTFAKSHTPTRHPNFAKEPGFANPLFDYFITRNIHRLKVKFLGLLLLLCFVVPIATTFVMLQYQKRQVKREVNRKIIAGIETEELVLLKFTEQEKQTQLNWEYSKEFEYKGESYDIVVTEVVGDTTYYRCWWDYEETKLNRQFDKLVSIALGNNSKNRENQKRLFKFFKSLYFSIPAEGKSFAAQAISNNYFFEPDFYQSVSTLPPAPPPKIG